MPDQEEASPLLTQTEACEVDSSPAAEQVTKKQSETAQPVASCRVCLEEDEVAALVQPCCCCGSMQYAHHTCIQKWINEKGSLSCEICKQPYTGDYAAPPPRPRTVMPALHPAAWRGLIFTADPETGALLAHRAVEVPATLPQYLPDGTMDEDDPATAPTGAAWCFSAVLIIITLLLIRHAFNVFFGPVPDPQGGEWGPDRHPDAPVGFDDPSGPVEDIDGSLLVIWLTIRCFIIVLPMYAVLRVMSSVNQRQSELEIERNVTALLWAAANDLEAGTRERQTPREAPQAPAAALNSGAVELQPAARAPTAAMQLHV
ncbi:hypothetical protein WJX72_001322 [[Myrmecia] bisecta]|uniref:RING-CH-type domain-containing protein n=1 Tax=[Myrmecia] bisecta TaxID=41462 RepID=A0AAW1QPA3_9CHLO